MRDMLVRLIRWEADPVGFGHLFRGRFPSWQAWEAYNWPDRVRGLRVGVSAEVRIRRYGLVRGGDRVDGGR